MKTRLIAVLALSLAAIFSVSALLHPRLVASAQQTAMWGSSGGTVTCVSTRNRQVYCPGDTRGGVLLQQQIGPSPCVLERTWGFDGRGIWVDKGCGGRFQVSGYSGGPWWWDDGDRRPPQQGMPKRGACFYTSANFQGKYFCVPSGTGFDVVPSGFNDAISSIQIRGRAVVTIYNDANYRSFSAPVRSSVPDLRTWSLAGYNNKNWNNRISSLQVK
jgi:Protein of unknown function (DUF3011)/Peptidase inhibitor family I36